MNRNAYDRYLAAFNAKDYGGVADFYAEPIAMEFFGVQITSRDALIDFYSFLHSYVKETVTVTNFAASDTLTAVDAIVRVEGIRDLDATTLAARGLHEFFPIEAGEVQDMRQFIFYTIHEGKIAKVECALA
jgi:hypothetical protein